MTEDGPQGSEGDAAGEQQQEVEPVTEQVADVVEAAPDGAPEAPAEVQDDTMAEAASAAADPAMPAHADLVGQTAGMPIPEEVAAPATEGDPRIRRRPLQTRPPKPKPLLLTNRAMPSQS